MRAPSGIFDEVWVSRFAGTSMYVCKICDDTYLARSSDPRTNRAQAPHPCCYIHTHLAPVHRYIGHPTYEKDPYMFFTAARPPDKIRLLGHPIAPVSFPLGQDGTIALSSALVDLKKGCTDETGCLSFLVGRAMKSAAAAGARCCGSPRDQ